MICARSVHIVPYTPHVPYSLHILYTLARFVRIGAFYVTLCAHYAHICV